jgi:hypothetical protein
MDIIVGLYIAIASFGSGMGFVALWNHLKDVGDKPAKLPKEPKQPKSKRRRGIVKLEIRDKGRYCYTAVFEVEEIEPIGDKNTRVGVIKLTGVPDCYYSAEMQLFPEIIPNEQIEWYN